MDDNSVTGQHLYAAGDEETREWFHKQWEIWPHRAHHDLTTNASLHLGGVKAYRIEHGNDPKMSHDFKTWVTFMDRLSKDQQNG